MNIGVLKEDVDQLLHKVLKGEEPIPKLKNTKRHLKNGMVIDCYGMCFEDKLIIEWRGGFIFAIIDETQYLLNSYVIDLEDDNIEMRCKEWSDYIKRLFIEVREYSKEQHEFTSSKATYGDVI